MTNLELKAVLEKMQKDKPALAFVEICKEAKVDRSNLWRYLAEGTERDIPKGIINKLAFAYPLYFNNLIDNPDKKESGLSKEKAASKVLSQELDTFMQETTHNMIKMKALLLTLNEKVIELSSKVTGQDEEAIRDELKKTSNLLANSLFDEL